MADESDVEVALAAACAAAIYPDGPAGPAIVGYSCRIARGDPLAQALNADLAAGVVNVAVTLRDQVSRNTTRYADAWQPAAVQTAASLVVGMAGNVATFSGAGDANLVVGVRAGGQAYTYAAGAGDTPASIAAGLARQIAGASATGAALSLPVTGGPPLAVVYTAATAINETRRQEQGFGIAILAPSPDARTAVAAVIDQAVAQTGFLRLADGSAGRLRYRSTRIDDAPGRANLWRRDLLCTVEYGTTVTTRVPRMVFGELALNGAAAGSITH